MAAASKSGGQGACSKLSALCLGETRQAVFEYSNMQAVPASLLDFAPAFRGNHGHVGGEYCAICTPKHQRMAELTQGWAGN
eukprot:830596-Pelagomonas_calceolata.AAC.4